MPINRLALTGLAVGLLLAPAAHADPSSPLHVLVDTAAQRLQTAEPVAAFKWINGGAITDAQRAQQVLDTVSADAAAQHVDPAFVHGIFRDQIDATEGIEYIRFGQWKFEAGTAPHIAPDLSESRAAIDSYNKSMVNEVALHWNSLVGPTCAAELDAARSAVIAERALDPMYQQALWSATRSYCRTT